MSHHRPYSKNQQNTSNEKEALHNAEPQTDATAAAATEAQSAETIASSTATPQSPGTTVSDPSAEQNAGAEAQSEVTVLKQQLAALSDTHLRLMAEYDNYRKRTMREKADLLRSAGENVLISILPVMDNFERALKTMETATDIAAVRDGVQLIFQQLMTCLQQHGVQPIVTELQPFDTELHEAVTTIPAPEEALKGKVIDCTQTGYKLHDKVIRHAKVVVGE